MKLGFSREAEAVFTSDGMVNLLKGEESVETGWTTCMGVYKRPHGEKKAFSGFLRGKGFYTLTTRRLIFFTGPDEGEKEMESAKRDLDSRLDRKTAKDRDDELMKRDLERSIEEAKAHAQAGTANHEATLKMERLLLGDPELDRKVREERRRLRQFFVLELSHITSVKKKLLVAEIISMSNGEEFTLTMSKPMAPLIEGIMQKQSITFDESQNEHIADLKDDERDEVAYLTRGWEKDAKNEASDEDGEAYPGKGRKERAPPVPEGEPVSKDEPAVDEPEAEGDGEPASEDEPAVDEPVAKGDGEPVSEDEPAVDEPVAKDDGGPASEDEPVVDEPVAKDDGGPAEVVDPPGDKDDDPSEGSPPDEK